MRSTLDLDPADVSVAPLGSVDQPESAFLLAGRFRDERVAHVRRIVEAENGAIVADVDEGRTRPRSRQVTDGGHMTPWGHHSGSAAR